MEEVDGGGEVDGGRRRYTQVERKSIEDGNVQSIERRSDHSIGGDIRKQLKVSIGIT